MTDSILTSNYNEVLGDGAPTANVTATYSEVLNSGEPSATLTSTYLEVIGPMPIFEELTSVKHEVFYENGGGNVAATSTKMEVIYQWVNQTRRRTIILVNKTK